MPILTATAIEGYKVYTNRIIACARYKVGSTYTQVAISRRERLKDGRVAVYFPIDARSGSDITVTEVQLIDNNSDVWASKKENIVICGVQEGVLYRFTFDFEEV